MSLETLPWVNSSANTLARLPFPAVGIVAGAVISIAATRVIEKMLYGVSATDPAAFAGVVVLLALVALVASWVPARRASRTEAMDVLRAA